MNDEDEVKEYMVKVKDFDENTTHTIHQLGHTQNEANSIVMDYLVDALGTPNLEIV